MSDICSKVASFSDEMLEARTSSPRVWAPQPTGRTSMVALTSLGDKKQSLIGETIRRKQDKILPSEDVSK